MKSNILLILVIVFVIKARISKAIKCDFKYVEYTDEDQEINPQEFKSSINRNHFRVPVKQFIDDFECEDSSAEWERVPPEINILRPSTTTRKPDYLLTTRRTLDDRFDQRPPDQYPPDMYPSAPPAPTEPSTTFRYEEEEVESECISSVKTFRPKMMNNYLNQMTKVVNNSNFTHLVPYNECTSIDEPCHSCCPAPRGYRNMCRPTYSQTLLFAQLTDGTIYRDSFYFPGPCKCAMMRRKTRQTTNAPLT